MSSTYDNLSKEFIHEITRAQPSIIAYIRSLLPTHPDYMDVLQEVNVTLWQKRKNYRSGSNFKAWAFQIARFHVLHTHRKMVAEGKRLVFNDALLETLAGAAPFDEDIMMTRISALNLCLKKLAPRQKELIEFRYGSKLSIEDYAKQNNRNPGTIRATLRRIRATLRQCIRTTLSGEADS